jgi:hypothetical protein
MTNNSHRTSVRAGGFAILLASAWLSGCGGGGGGGSVATYRVGGKVSGLLGEGLVLTANATDVAVNGSGVFVFPNVADGSAYKVTIKNQPGKPTQTCNVVNGAGTVAGADVTDIEVVCPEVWHGTKQFGAAGTGTMPYAMAADGEGNVYVAGYTGGSLFEAHQTGSTDYFFVKFDPLGKEVFAKQGGVSGQQTQGHGMTIDADGNVYVVGQTTGDLGGTKTGFRDYFIAKYDALGALKYLAQGGAAGANTDALGVAVDAGGNAYVVGYTKGALDTSDKGAPHGAADLYVAKYDAAGTRVYVRQAGSAGVSSEARDVAVDGDGTVYVLGSTYGDLDGSGLRGNQDLVIARYDTDGNTLPLFQQGSVGASVSASRIRVDTGHNIYVAGSVIGDFEGSTHVGTSDGFVLKYDSSWSRVYIRRAGAAGVLTYGEGFDLDDDGTVYLSGVAAGALGGDPQQGTTDAFAAQFAADGSPGYLHQFGADGVKNGSIGVAARGGRIYVGGYTEGGLDGNNLTGNRDAFVTKYDTAGEKQ